MYANNLLSLILSLLEEHQYFAFILNVLIKSTAVLFSVGMINLLLLKFSAATRHLIWAVSFIGLIFLPVIILVVPSIELEIVNLSALQISENRIESIRENVQTLTQEFNTVYQLSLIIYISIVFFMLAYTAIGIYRLHKLTHNSIVINPADKPKDLQALLNQVGLFNDIPILENETLLSPLSWGLFKPVIILPANSQHWSEEKMANVLIHEMCHIQRFDWLSQIFSRIVNALYWFNPLAWYAVKEHAKEAEHACDDAVVLYGKSCSQYAEDLLDIAKGVNQKDHRYILAQAIAHSFIGNRVVAILDSSLTRNKTDGVWVIRALLTIFTIVIFLASLKLTPAVKDFSLEQGFSRSFQINYITDPTNNTSDESINPNELEHLPNKEGIEELPINTRDASLLPMVNNTIPDFNLEPVSIGDKFSLVVANNATLNFEVKEIRTQAPLYPANARTRNIEGYTIIEYEISAQGFVTNPVVIESEPNQIFTQAALDALSGYQFEPPTFNGQAIAIGGLQTKFIFQLNPKPG